MIKRLLAVLVCMFMFVSWGNIASAQDEGVVEFRDANLALTVRAHLELAQNAPITQQELRRLVFLNVPGHEIRSLIGLEHAINLTDLWLDVNQISDLTPLANLTQLKTLDCGENLISDLTPLSGLGLFSFKNYQLMRVTDSLYRRSGRA